MGVQPLNTVISRLTIQMGMMLTGEVPAMMAMLMIMSAWHLGCLRSMRVHLLHAPSQTSQGEVCLPDLGPALWVSGDPFLGFYQEPH